jgi:hypothetical protein
MDLYEMLSRCTVRVSLEDGRQGSGFFVCPGFVLTCSHVISSELKSSRLKPSVRIYSDGIAYVADVVAQSGTEYPDLALLQLEVTDHPCVYLREGASPNDQLFITGFPISGNLSHSESVTVKCEGWRRDDCATNQFVKFGSGEIRPGFSGGPVLNEQTGGVCGVVKRTRGADTTLGGFAIPVQESFTLDHSLRNLQLDYHRSVHDASVLKRFEAPCSSENPTWLGVLKPSNLRTYPIQLDVLARLESSRSVCQDLNLPYRTTHMLYTLLEMPSRFAEQCFNRVLPEQRYGTQLRSLLKDFIKRTLSERDRRNEQAYVPFEWDERDEIQSARQEMLLDNSSGCSERHVLLGVLNTPSNVIKEIRRKMGSEVFSQLRDMVRAARDERTSHSREGTPILEGDFDLI